MKKIFKRTLIAIFLFSGFFISQSVWAACDLKLICPKTGATYTCSVASQECIQAAVDDAAEGDAIKVTATGEVVWPSPLIITKKIQLLGPETGTLTIKPSWTITETSCDSYKASGALISYKISSLSSSLFRISRFTFDCDYKTFALHMDSGSLKYDITNRIDHNVFKNLDGSVSPCKRPITIVGSMGLIDNNIFSDVNTAIGIYGNNYWWATERYIQGGANDLFIEDNIFNIYHIGYGTGAGGRYTSRYNTWNFIPSGEVSPHDMHGNQLPDSNGNNALMGATIYGNKIARSGGAFSAMNIANQRGGKLLAYYNDASGFNTASLAVKLREESGDQKMNYPVGPSPEYQPQHLSSSYQWNNRHNNNLMVNKMYDQCRGDCAEGTLNTSFQTADVSTWCSYCISENHDYWQQRSTGIFNGTGSSSAGGGVGCGPLSSRPLICTPGVAYWATNQSCADLTGMVGANPATPIQGTLYKCTAENTWTEYYTPYNYPHPLRNETLVCIQGDIDCDNQINSQDIQLAINVFLGTETDEDRKNRADLNGDNQANILDIQGVINIILGI